MTARRAIPCMAALVCLLLLPIPAYALRVVSHWEGYVAPTQTFEFSITLDSIPDFFTFDQQGRAKDQFQYWISWDLHPGDPNYPFVHPDVLVRGPMTDTPGGLPVCGTTGGGGPGCAGGWGPNRGIVPYQLNGSTITWSVPRDMLGDSDGVFSYFLGVTRYGGFTDQRTGNSGQGPVATRPETWGRIKQIYR